MKNFSSLFVIPKYWPAVGGAELHTRELAHRMSHLHSVAVIHHSANDSELLETVVARSQPKQIQDGQMTVNQIGVNARLRPVLHELSKHVESSRTARKVYNVMLKKSIQPQLDTIAKPYDIIHSVYNGLTPLTLAAMETAEKEHKPFVWTPLAHTLEPQGSAWSSPSFKAMYQRADALITMTRYEKDFLVEMGAPSRKVFVNPVSVLLEDEVDATAFRERYKIGNAPFVLFLGRHVRDKGYHTLREAAEKIWQQHAHTRFVFIGPGDADADEFFSRIHDARIIRIAKISDTEKCSALAACNLLCVPSIKESLGVIYLEAWYYAKPVVAIDLPVLRTVIDDGQDGYLCRPEAVPVADRVIQLLDDPQLCASMGLAGQHKVSKKYNWDRIANDMHDLYAELIGRFMHRLAG